MGALGAGFLTAGPGHDGVENKAEIAVSFGRLPFHQSSQVWSSCFRYIYANQITSAVIPPFARYKFIVLCPFMVDFFHVHSQPQNKVIVCLIINQTIIIITFIVIKTYNVINNISLTDPNHWHRFNF